ncbi:MAG: YitT family protein [Firmicutes bacterium]|nr:YitT family protein [Bacillota bacterium]
MQNRRFTRTLTQYIGILLGSFITALGINALQIPNRIAAGGATGIATIIYHLTGFEPGFTFLLINIPLLIITGFVLGWRFSWFSVLGGLATSGWVYVTRNIAPWTDDPILAALYGGVVVGTGIGIVFRSRGSTGGTDLAAGLLSHFTGLPIGKALLFIDSLIVAAAGFVFGPTMAMYALVCIFVTTRVIDYVNEGFFAVKALLIISEQGESIAEQIMTELRRGVTYLHSEGGFSKASRKTLLVVVSRSEIITVKNLVRAQDPRAFVIVIDAHEVLGEGFKELSTTI